MPCAHILPAISYPSLMNLALPYPFEVLILLLSTLKFRWQRLAYPFWKKVAYPSSPIFSPILILQAQKLLAASYEPVPKMVSQKEKGASEHLASIL